MLDWESDNNEVMINPRLPKEEKAVILALLEDGPSIKGHVWMATSGTTAENAGHLKWAALSKTAILASANAVNALLKSTSKDIWINPLPSFHVGGLGIWARSYLSRAKVIDAFSALQGKWDPLKYYHLLCENKGTLTSLVPAQVYDLSTLKLPSPPSLRAAIVGGGALHEPLFFKAKALGWKLLPSYGLTECCSQVATSALEEASSDSMPPLELLPHMQAEIDVTGRIRLKSPSLLTLYALKNSEGTHFFDPKIDGWFLTDDKGYLNGKSITIHGRPGYFIKIGGESVDLLRLERILDEIRLAAINRSDMTLVPIPDERLGHVIHLAAASQDRPPIQAIVEKFNEKALPFERIRQIHYFDVLPRSALSKLMTNELMKAIIAGKGLV